MDTAWTHASDIAAAVRDGRSSAAAVIDAALARIARHDRVLNAFTAVVETRARAKAEAIDAARKKGRPPGALAGVPFAVKNLFDVAGLPTLAGSKINRDRPPAARDATLIERLEAHGRRARRRAQHGRICLRLHRREFARRPVAQSARSAPHDRRLLRRLGRRGRRRIGPDCARLGHQRLDPRAGLAVRDIRPEADLRPAVARPHLPLRGEPRSRRPLGPQHHRSGARLRRDAGPRSRRSGLRRSPGGGGRAAARSRHRRSAHRHRRRLLSEEHVRGGANRARARRRRARRHATKSRFRRRNARAPRLTSSPRAKAARCTSIACKRVRAISIPPCATA